MRGAIVGDIIGSAFIQSPQVTMDFQLLKPFSSYTDDTVLTISTADAILNNKPYEEALKEWARKYPKAGYQEGFLEWVFANKKASYQSEGDGAARRISPIGYAAATLNEAMEEATKATRITHPSETKIKASRAFCGVIFLAKSGYNKKAIRDFLFDECAYELPSDFSKDCVRFLGEKYLSPVPCAIMAFLNSSNFEDAIRKAIWLGGPSNTIGSITGALAQAHYQHIPKSIIRKSLSRLSDDLESVLSAFEQKYCQNFLTEKKEIQINFK